MVIIIFNIKINRYFCNLLSKTMVNVQVKLISLWFDTIIATMELSSTIKNSKFFNPEENGKKFFLGSRTFGEGSCHNQMSERIGY